MESRIFTFSLSYSALLLCFVAKSSPAWAIGSSFSCLLCHFHMPRHWPFLFIFEHLLSDARRASWLILNIFCPSLRLSHFSWELWFLVLENGIRNQDLSARCASFCWGVISSTSSQLTEKNTYVYANVYTHTKNFCV